MVEASDFGRLAYRGIDSADCLVREVDAALLFFASLDIESWPTLPTSSCTVMNVLTNCLDHAGLMGLPFWSATMLFLRGELAYRPM